MTPDKPASGTLKHLLTRTFHGISGHQLPDRAAALTYYAVLSIFPALVALVSILGLVGQGQSTTDKLIDMIREVAPPETADQLRAPISTITENPGAGIGLIFGVLAAVWTASKYVNAFGRAMNSIYEVPEGRPTWKLRPQMYALTALLIVLVSVVALLLVLSGPVATTIGDLVGLGATALTVWGIAKWPVLAAAAVLTIAILYYFTPNVRQPKFRWVSAGAVVALVAAALATAGLAGYLQVMGGGSYNRMYGSLAGVILFLLWLWIMNLMLLVGGELDAEIERARELHRGIAAEDDIQLPLRDTKKAEADRDRQAKLSAQARELRSAERLDDER